MNLIIVDAASCSALIVTSHQGKHVWPCQDIHLRPAREDEPTGFLPPPIGKVLVHLTHGSKGGKGLVQLHEVPLVAWRGWRNHIKAMLGSGSPFQDRF